MATVALVCASFGIAGGMAVLTVLGVRLLIRRMDAWAEATIFSLVGFREIEKLLRDRKETGGKEDQGAPHETCASSGATRPG